MPYNVITKPTFMDDILDFDKSARKQLSQMYSDLAAHAEESRGNTIKKLSGFKRLWRYRIADYRIIYAVNENVVQLLAAGIRRDVYDRFDYDPDNVNEAATMALEATLFPNSSVAQELKSQENWAQYAVEQQKKQQEKRREQQLVNERLPRAITTEMLNRWNIPEEHHGAFTACTTETQLLDAQAPMDVVERVLNLVFSKDAVAIAEEPSYIIPSGQKLEEYVEGKISRFLLNLDDKQLELVDWALEGPTLIKGGPGSGKSTVAMYRARAIIDNAIHHGQKTPRILFTTYTNALVNVSKELLSQLLTNYDADIDVRTPDSIAKSYADKSLKKYKIESDDIWLKAIEEVRPIFKPSAGSALQNSMLLESIKNVEDDYIAEEIQIIIEGRGLDNVEAYVQTERSGRGVGLTERQRQTIWQLYVTAEKWIVDQGLRTWGMIRKVALSEVKSSEPEYDYVIIDEAQDLTPVMLRICIGLVKDTRNIFIAADKSQSIYNSRFSYSKVDEDLSVSHRTRILKRNYRTTTEIVRGAVEIMKGEDVGDEDTLVQQCVKFGPKPLLILQDSEDEQLDEVVRFIREQSRQVGLPTGAAAVLCPTNHHAKNVADKLRERGLPATYMTKSKVELETPEVKVLTLHTAKGLEFPIVAIPIVRDGTLPGNHYLDRPDKRQDYLNSQKRLFFVGATRAMRRLIVTANRDNARSEFISQLTARGWNIIQ